MFESLIHEAQTRFSLGDNAKRLVRMLVDALFDSGTGGFSGMRVRFADVGLGDRFASWIGTSPGENVLQPEEFSAGFGAATAGNIAARLGYTRAAVNGAGAWLLPKIVGLVTRGGAIPDARPPGYDLWFTSPAVDMAARNAAETDGGRWGKWLIVLLVLLAVAFFAPRGCSQDRSAPDAAPAGQSAVAAWHALRTAQVSTRMSAPRWS